MDGMYEHVWIFGLLISPNNNNKKDVASTFM